MVSLLEKAGHDVLTPDLFDGKTFQTIEEGLDYFDKIGTDTVFHKAQEACKDLTEFSVIGYSLGAMLAQEKLQTNQNISAAFLVHSVVEPAYLSGDFPATTPVHVFAMAEDPFFKEDGGVQLLEKLQTQNPHLTAHIYAGKGHLFTEPDQHEYDAELTKILENTVLSELEKL